MYFQTNDHKEFYNSRMSVQQFNYLHDLLKPMLKKRSRREPLPTEVRVADVEVSLMTILYCNYN